MARSAVPAAGQRQEASLDKPACEVLLGHGHFLPRPTLSEVAEVGHQRVAYRALQPVDSQQPVEHLMGGVLVEALECVAEPRGKLRGSLDRPVGKLAPALHPRDLARRLGGGQPAPELLLHEADAPLVAGAVHAVSALGAARPQHAVALLPRPKHVGAHSHAVAQLADPKVRGVIHCRATTPGQTLDTPRWALLPPGRGGGPTKEEQMESLLAVDVSTSLQQGLNSLFAFIPNLI